MMLITTITPTILLLLLIYFVVIRKVPKRLAWISYTIIIVISGLCFYQGSVHLSYMGIENLSLGIFLVWLHYHFEFNSQSKKEA